MRRNLFVKLMIMSMFLVTMAFSFYNSNSNVINLTSSNFNKEVVNSPDIWLVEFYAPWCGHCQRLVPEYEKLANALKGIVKIGAVDADADRSLGGTYGIRGFPTIKFFGLNKANPEEYQGDRSAEAMVRFILDKIRDITNKRLSGKSESSSRSSSQSEGKKSSGSASSDNDVVVLTEDNFEETVLRSKELWMVDFYAPWCGHCKNLEPEWNKAATELKGKVKVGKVDATVHQSLAGRYGIQGYPTIKVFPAGEKGSKVDKYEGPRDSSAIVAFALDQLEKYGIIPDVEQLTNDNQFKEFCKERTGVCVISFLPHIMDSSAQQRKGYIEDLKLASKSGKGKPIYFFWAQGGDYFDFEDKLHLSFGYPAVVAVNFSKKKYSVCRTSFGPENIKTFVNNLLIGKEPLMNLPELPKLKSVAQWDGKDAIRDDL